jgi:hypothetical protein
MTKGQKIALIVAGVVTLISGVGFFIFRNRTKNEEENTSDEEFTNPVELQVSNNSSSNSQTETTTLKPSSDVIADENVKKGSKGDAAKGVQVIINEIARWRGWSGQTKKAANGKSVKFPISTDGDFGTNSDTAARLIFDNYQADLSITRHKARMKWAYAAGFYKKAFPDGLKNVSRRADYTNEFIRGGKASK